MNSSTLITIAFAAVTVSHIALCAFLLWQQRNHYESLLSDVRADNRDLRDRLFASKNLPPSGVDMRQAHEERREDRRRQQSDQTRKSGPDPMWEMKQKLVGKEKARLDKPK